VTPSIVAFGEALLDVYPDRAVVAGAPLHVAAHLADRGWTSYLVTRLGQDHDGDLVREEMAARGVDMRFVETDRRAPTGTVAIELLPNGGHRFTIGRSAAWDFIAGPEELPPHDALVYGTLAGRSPTSRAALLKVLRRSRAPLRVFDVNLRPPDVDEDVLKLGLAHAILIKAAEDELEVVASVAGGDVFAAAPQARWLCVTRGERGAELRSRDGRVWTAPSRAASGARIVDTVGAGDAFTAGLIAALGTGAGPEDALETARGMAEGVLSVRGGLPPRAS
jgi:fructokinase